jgi:hypothetical protein
LRKEKYPKTRKIGEINIGIRYFIFLLKKIRERMKSEMIPPKVITSLPIIKRNTRKNKIASSSSFVLPKKINIKNGKNIRIFSSSENHGKFISFMPIKKAKEIGKKYFST